MSVPVFHPGHDELLGNTVVVFNPMTWPVRQPVTVDDRLTQGLNGVWQLFDDSDEINAGLTEGAEHSPTAARIAAAMPQRAGAPVAA